MAGLQSLVSIRLRQLQVPSQLPYIAGLVNFPKRSIIMQSTTHDEAKDEVVDSLARKKCVPCSSKELRPMDEDAAKVLLQKVPGWKLSSEDGHLKLERSWKTKSFLKGLELFKAIADVAESEGHHPNLHLVNWNDARVDIWTHAIGGLTENDFILAAKISELDVQALLRKRATGGTSQT